MGLPPKEMAKRARALAQAHPLSPLAKRYHDRTVAEEGRAQPLVEIGIWAGAGLMAGYCLRRVEENQAGLVLEPVSPSGMPDGDGDGDGGRSVEEFIDELAGRATTIASEVRAGAGHHLLGDEEQVVAALDRIIASEVERRLYNWKESFDDEAWAEFERYLTWWVLQGYALRVAEVAAGAVA